jgi:integrase
VRKKKRRQPVSRHSGVVIDPPRGRHGYRARWIDPLTGKERRVTLDLERYPDDFARRKWAEQRSAELRISRLDKREGLVTVTLADAIERYLASCKRTRRARTISDYTRVAEIFKSWALEHGIRFAREISAHHLEQFRESRVLLGRAPNTVNIELRAVATMLRAFRRLGWLETTREQIGENLRQEQVPSEEIEFLKPAECRALLQRALEHDRELFKLTRKEKRKGLAPGTARYPSIAPFIVFVMCTGVRFGEALSLRWEDVDVDDAGGFIRLAAGSTKTKRARRYLLSTPAP